MKINKLIPYLFLLPALLAFGITAFLPIIQALYLSFTNYDLINKPNFIGWQNYINLGSDRLFWQVLLNTIIYLVCAVPLLIVIPLFLAILVNQKLRGMQLFRAIYYFPVVISVVVAGLAWKWIYAENGLLNFIISAISWQSIKINWLTDSKTAIFAIIAVTVWRGLGYYMVIYLAGLQSIPPDLYEAAAIDGSDGWLKHFDITIPLLKPYIILVAVMSSISAMKIFEEVFIMSRGGPANSTKTIVYYLYEKGFGSLEMGYASAIGIVVFMAIFLVSITTFKFINSQSLNIPTASDI
ncbi:permease component of ABC-type sugar transporter [Synechococcus sp. PCC 7502]|uniref:carbohydrate ABC transporter permease n=1 Tax=Synechococcus sp. PCC 7502 TaxID=1173263 RepID=UPI00029FC690|nr:sugar ABC transporter permease [Synechococcus sp. PCC 7502]AFY74428.1 permease component of ABC-type sugar transporter [Synechococcus sp. PCC 7502]